MSESERDAPAGLPAPAAARLPHRRPVRHIGTLQVLDGRGGPPRASVTDNPLLGTPHGALGPTAHMERIA